MRKQIPDPNRLDAMGSFKPERVKLLALQKKIDGDLRRFEAEFERILTGQTPLTEDICAHIRAGKSKRFRPILVLLSAKYGDGIDERALTAAAAVELVHTATLIHDDFIDEAVMRRGMPSVNAKWGGDAALIMGDYIYSAALEVLGREGLHPAIATLAATTRLMAEAEMMQLETRYRPEITEEYYLGIIYRKTASLIEASCRIGAAFNPGADGAVDAFGEFGHKIGLVFQITDDIFDFLGDERRLGKPTGQDWEEGRCTLPLIAALREGPAERKRRLLEVAVDRVHDRRRDFWPEVKDFVMEYGGVDYARDMARRFGEEAKNALAPVATGTQKDLLAVAVEYVINRLN